MLCLSPFLEFRRGCTLTDTCRTLIETQTDTATATATLDVTHIQTQIETAVRIQLTFRLSRDLRRAPIPPFIAIAKPDDRIEQLTTRQTKTDLSTVLQKQTETEVQTQTQTATVENVSTEVGRAVEPFIPYPWSWSVRGTIRGTV